MRGRDTKKEFDEAYEQAHTHWSGFLTEAEIDLKFGAGDQWDATNAAYLKGQGREAFVSNKMRRVHGLITGYQRKNRLSLKIEPVEGSDEKTASQLSGVVQSTMTMVNGYNIMSDAFSGGPIKTGFNLVGLYMDYSDDPLNGDIKLSRRPFNRFLVDPLMSTRDFSDCGYMLTREYLNQDAVKALLPKSKKHFANISSRGLDDKFPMSIPPKAIDGKDPYRWDEFYVRKFKEYTLLVDPRSGAQKIWEGNKKQLELLQNMIVLQGQPELKELRVSKKVIELNVFLDDELVYTGPDAVGLDDYPYVPLIGFFDPEISESKWKLQGLYRCMRDPQTIENKLRSKVLDMIESQISTGWKAKEDAVKNPGQLFQSGQGQVVWMDKQAEMTDAEKIQAADIPQGMFQVIDIIAKDIMEIPGANSELMGMPENENLEVAAMLSKMRQASGLTILQEPFDNYRLSKKLLGSKLVKAVQVNYDPQKIQRIINEQPTQEFYGKQFGKYDCTPTEGLLTDTQRHMYFAQLMQMKQLGAPIPWSAIIDAAPLEDKEDLKEKIEAEEKAQAQAAQQNQSAQMMQQALLQSKLQGDVAKSKRDLTQAEENRTQAMLDRAKMIQEMQGMDFDKAMQILSFMKEVSEGQQLQNQGGQ